MVIFNAFLMAKHILTLNVGHVIEIELELETKVMDLSSASVSPVIIEKSNFYWIFSKFLAQLCSQIFQVFYTYWNLLSLIWLEKR